MQQATEQNATSANEAGRNTNAAGSQELPMQVVERQQPDRPRRSRFYVPIPLRILLVIMAVAAGIVFGGVNGLYRQPKPLQMIMAYLNLQPGGGSEDPIALPVKANEPTATSSDSGNGSASATPSPSPSPSPSASPGQQQTEVTGLGHLVPKGEVITVALPSGAGDARIARLSVTEGDRVSRGDIVAVLDNEHSILAAIGTAESNLAVQRANLGKVRSNVLSSKAEAAAALASAEAAAENAELELARTKKLLKSQTVTVAAVENKQAIARQARRKVEQAKATLSRFTSKDIDAQSDVVVARQNYLAAQAELNRVRQDLERAYVRSPINATVLEIHVRPGEKPGLNGVVDLGDIDHMNAKVEIYQSQIGLVSTGDPVTIISKALSQPIKGRVIRIGLQVKRQTVIGSDPAANTDARVVEVTVGLDAESSAIASRFTNLQVEAKIMTGSKP